MDPEEVPRRHLSARTPGAPLRVRVFQHVPFEDVGSLAGWIADRGHPSAYTRLFAGESPPPPTDYELLVVMGGPMGVHDEGRIPWLTAEKRAIAAALAAGRPVLGVCLGAQLLADVLGARVARNAHPEIGWHEVVRAPEAAGTWLAEAFPERFTPFHWHGDAFEVPAGAVPLGASAACAAQGFLWEGRALALQFHPEVTGAAIEDLIRECGDELRPGPFVQDAAAIRAGAGAAAALNRMAAAACDRLARAARPA